MEQARVKDQPSLRLSRTYPVAPEKVWRAWTDPEAIKKWWGPGGQDHECAGIYREVVPNRKLVFTWCWPNSTPDRVSQVTILFEPAGGGTDLEFLHEQLFDEAARDGHERGWSESLVKLERFLNETN